MIINSNNILRFFFYWNWNAYSENMKYDYVSDLIMNTVRLEKIIGRITAYVD